MWTDYVEIYDDTITSLNSYTGGPFQEALSAITNLNTDWYNGSAYQSYAFEYQPGADGSVTWYVGQDKTWTVDARAIRPNGNVGQRILPYEPMALVMNFGMSNSFAALNLTALGASMPATMRFDYVRIYQDDDADGGITCDPDGYPTTAYIAQHGEAYQNPNNTRWYAPLPLFLVFADALLGYHKQAISGQRTPSQATASLFPMDLRSKFMSQCYRDDYAANPFVHIHRSNNCIADPALHELFFSC